MAVNTEENKNKGNEDDVNHPNYYPPTYPKDDYEFKFRKPYQGVFMSHKELFDEYNYPCWDLSLLEKNIVPVPYVPKDKVNCKHKYSLEYKKWAEIVKSLCKNYVEYLLTGNPLELPAGMGSIQLKKWKYKTPKSINVIKTKEKGEAVFNDYPETRHYSPLFKWNRRHNVRLPYKYFWKVNLTNRAWKKISKTIRKDFSVLEKFVEA